jgi:hypothetical protein
MMQSARRHRFKALVLFMEDVIGPNLHIEFY